MKEKLTRFLRINVTRFIMRVFWLFPLRKKQVFFSAYEGKQYSCNPKVIFEKMRRDENFKDFTYIWEINNPSLREQISYPNVRFVAHNTFSYFFSILTSKWLITNTGICARIPVRSKQININTWHGGGGFKKVGYATTKEVSGGISEVSIASMQTTHFLSSSALFTKVMQPSIRLPMERFLPIGMPRNDIFFDEQAQKEARQKVFKKYGIEENVFLMLYAPTYRGSVGKDIFAFDMKPLYALKEACKDKFGKDVVLMVRMHYFNQSEQREEGVLSVSDYLDMQELLAATDMLITDYSSSMWDFGLSKKLCILYTPDLKEYDLERGFYTSPSSWPGILCEREEEMIAAVKEFDAVAYKQKLSGYYQDAVCYDKGTAGEQLLKMIKAEM